jgi:hypothetical protein
MMWQGDTFAGTGPGFKVRLEVVFHWRVDVTGTYVAGYGLTVGKHCVLGSCAGNCDLKACPLK